MSANNNNNSVEINEYERKLSQLKIDDPSILEDMTTWMEYPLKLLKKSSKRAFARKYPTWLTLIVQKVYPFLRELFDSIYHEYAKYFHLKKIVLNHLHTILSAGVIHLDTATDPLLQRYFQLYYEHYQDFDQEDIKHMLDIFILKECTQKYVDLYARWIVDTVLPFFLAEKKYLEAYELLIGTIFQQVYVPKSIKIRFNPSLRTLSDVCCAFSEFAAQSETNEAHKSKAVSLFHSLLSMINKFKLCAMIETGLLINIMKGATQYTDWWEKERDFFAVDFFFSRFFQTIKERQKTALSVPIFFKVLLLSFRNNYAIRDYDAINTVLWNSSDPMFLGSALTDEDMRWLVTNQLFCTPKMWSEEYLRNYVCWFVSRAVITPHLIIDNMFVRISETLLFLETLHDVKHLFIELDFLDKKEDLDTLIEWIWKHQDILQIITFMYPFSSNKNVVHQTTYVQDYNKLFKQCLLFSLLPNKQIHFINVKGDYIPSENVEWWKLTTKLKIQFQQQRDQWNLYNTHFIDLVGEYGNKTITEAIIAKESNTFVEGMKEGFGYWGS